MKEPSLLGVLSTKKGQSSLLVIITFAGVIVLVLLPLFALVFDKGLVKLAAQEVTDQVDIQTYLIYQSVDFNALSHGSLKESGNLLELINDSLVINHPQVTSVNVSDIRLDQNRLVLSIEILLTPTLYRYVYDLNKVYTCQYAVALPLDGGHEK